MLGLSELSLMGIMALAMFVQSAAGFGSALIAMPLIIQVLGLAVAAPAFALIGQTSGLIMMLRYRDSLDWRAVSRLLAASLLAIPLSIAVAQRIDQQLALAGLGLVMLAYAGYTLFGPQLPEIQNPRWGYLFGFFNGLLHGAYNTGGPPLVIYGTAARWSPREFKSNIQTVFFINGLMVILTHLLHGNITPRVLHAYVIMLPGLALGLLLGFLLDKRIPPELFRRAVLVLLIILGITLILR